jgi:FtsZ-interacting cell division protein YlmF
MSEYQYYHFQAIDQPLSQQQMQALREISTRAEITPTSFINTYNWGDLKANPRELMRQYFDAHVYVANWGTHRLMLKVPRDLIDVDTAQLYCGECFTIYPSATHVILDFVSRDESGAYYDDLEAGEGWMASLLPLREDIMRGDLRALYLAWLAGVWEDDETEEPPILPGLSQLSGPLRQLARFLRLDEPLLQAALQGDKQTSHTEPCREDMATWIASLPNAEKDAMLCALLAADDESRHLASRLRQRFYKTWRQAHPADAQTVAQSRRTASTLWRISEALAAEEQCRKAAAKARQQAEQERQAAEQRKQYLASLATREAQVWQEVTVLLSATQPKNYEEAVRLLRDLRDVASDHGSLTQWEARLTEFRQRYARRPSLMQRFNNAGFP